MTDPPASQIAPNDLNLALRRVQRSVLATLAVCAGVIAFSGESRASADATALSPRFTYTAIAFGLLSIVTRRRPGRPLASPRTHVALSLVSLLAAGGVGIVGVAAALSGEPRATALLCVLAGAIFALRSPAPLAIRPPAEPS
jgi:peptidoglycan/LPS O-acetylase OafA/YrhL